MGSITCGCDVCDVVELLPNIWARLSPSAFSLITGTDKELAKPDRCVVVGEMSSITIHSVVRYGGRVCKSPCPNVGKPYSTDFAKKGTFSKPRVPTVPTVPF